MPSILNDALSVRSKPFDQAKGTKLVISGKKMTQTGKDGTKKATFRLHPTTSPKGIDMRQLPEEGRPEAKGIYQLEGDRLKLCVARVPRGSDPGAKRPTAFDSKQGLLLTFKREEK
jgi:uncharacterized protein (TIGR03067 family)